VASILRRKTGSVAVQFVDVNGNRRTLALGANPPERFVNRAAEVVDDLVAAANYGTPVDADVLSWLDGLKDDQHARFAAAGLVHSREKQSAKRVTVAEFADQYVARRSDLRPASLMVLRHVARNLSDFFGGKAMVDVTRGDGDDFARWLLKDGRSASQVENKGTSLGGATCGKRIQHASTIFNDAVRRGVIPSNPLSDVRRPAATNDERKVYVPAETIERLIELDPNPEWRLLLALARYLGLRTPSEPFSLTWDCVDWEKRRIRINSPKTERSGKPYRLAPILPEVMPHLEAVYAAAPEGAVYILDRLRNRDSMKAAEQGYWANFNLRTALLRKMTKAGIPPWPKLWHALRASAETDLAARFPLHTVTAWLGNTPTVATKHYLMVTDADFDSATECALHGALHGAAKMGEMGGSPSVNKHEKTRISAGFSNQSLERRGHEHPPENTENTVVSGSRAARRAARPSGTDHNPAQVSTGDTLLDRLLAAWGHLSDADRLALAEHAERLAGKHVPAR
jgi:integrase